VRSRSFCVIALVLAAAIPVLAQKAVQIELDVKPPLPEPAKMKSDVSGKIGSLFNTNQLEKAFPQDVHVLSGEVHRRSIIALMTLDAQSSPANPPCRHADMIFLAAPQLSAITRLYSPTIVGGATQELLRSRDRCLIANSVAGTPLPNVRFIEGTGLVLLGRRYDEARGRYFRARFANGATIPLRVTGPSYVPHVEGAVLSARIGLPTMEESEALSHWEARGGRLYDDGQAAGFVNSGRTR